MSIRALDLGNSRMKSARAERDGHPVILPNKLGEPFTHSVVNFPDNGDPVVGTEALNMAFAEPKKVVFNWKRHMGSDKVIYKRIEPLIGMVVVVEKATGEHTA